MKEREFRKMMVFYGAMAGVPVLLWLIAMSSPFPQLHMIRYVLGILVGIGSIIFGILGYREVFTRG
jgi:ABC-type phosphate transport system permease subunit